MSNSPKTVGRVSPSGRNPTSDSSAHGDVGLRDKAANPTYGSVTGEWLDTTWGNLATLEYGKSLRDYSGVAGKYRVFGTNGPIGWHDTPLCNKPGIIIGRKGAYRGIHYSATPFFVIDTAFYLEPKVKLDMKWAYYQLLTQDINGMDSGSAIPSTSRSDFYGLSVRVPPLTTQKSIAHILGTLDDKIELNRRMNETLEAIARAMFKSWFVDFDPVRAKMSGELPEFICQRLGLTPDLLAIFPDRFVDSELGEIPEGWKYSSIGKEVSIVGGATPSTTNPEYWNGEYAWVTPKDLSGVAAKVLIDSERKITQAGVNKISSGQLPKGSVLMSSRAPIGYLALAMIPVSINQGFIAMVCDKRLPNTYVLQWAIENLDAIKQRGSGTTFAEISKTSFRPMAVLVPDERVLKSFHWQVMPLYEQITAKVCESEMIATLRDTLLPKLLSGELRVPDAEEALEAQQP